MKKIICIFFVIVVWSLVSSSALGAAPGQGPLKIVLSGKDLGSEVNPVKCDEAKGEIEYLEKLRGPDGKPVIYERIGHGIAGGRVLDKFLIKSSDGKFSVVICMDMYCPGQCETVAVKGFSMDTGVVSTAKQPTQPVKPGKRDKKSKSTSTKKSPATPTVKTKKVSKGKTKTTGPKVKPKSVTPVQSRKSQPMTTEDKIPGFDDVPDLPKTRQKKQPVTKQPVQTKSTPAPSKPKTSTPKTTRTDVIPGFDDVTPPKTAAAHNKTYVSLVPIKAKPVKKKKTGGFSSLINQAVTDAFARLMKETSITMFMNQRGHSIAANKAQIDRLHVICKGKEDDMEKMEKVNNEILEPENIDFLLTGTIRYDKKSGEYKVNPVFAGRHDKKILLSREFTYDRNKKSGNVKKHFKEQIIDIIKAEFPTLASTKSSGGAPADLYICFVPLSDPSAVPAKKSLGELLNKPVDEGVKLAKMKNNEIEVNESGHTIHDADTAVAQLNDILFKAPLTQDEKAEKIVHDLMTPNGVDFIVKTKFTEDAQNNIIIVQPHVVSKPQKKIFSVNLIFQRDELVCEDPKSRESIICPNANDNITSAVQVLIEQAVK